VEADEIIYYRKEERAIAISKNKRVRSFYVEEKEKK
jgi:lipopolysaccharide export system protein LptA